MLPEREVITIRAATAADQPLITQLVHDARLNPLRLAWPNFLMAERREGEVMRVVGAGQLRPHKDGSLELASLVVIAGERGHGTGSRLVNALIDKAGGPLYLMCDSSKVSYYQRFHFYELTSPASMPRSLRGLYRMATWIRRVLGLFLKQPPRLAIMKHPGPQPS